MGDNKGYDLDCVRQLIDIMRQNDLAEVEIKHGDDKIFVKRSTGYVPAPGQPLPVAPAVSGQAPAPEGSGEFLEIKSPIVGTFYSAASPDAEPYVQVGSRIEPQAVICIIEAMKVMNEIKADTAGEVVEVCVKNGQAVEYGQVLFRVRPE